MYYITDDSRIQAFDEHGNVLAEVTFPVTDGTAVIDHVYVVSSLRGRNIASELLKRAVEQMFSDGHAIAATCSYALLWLRRHPEYKFEDNDVPLACRIDGKH